MQTIRGIPNFHRDTHPLMASLNIGGRWVRKYWKHASLALVSGVMIGVAYQISITPPVTPRVFAVQEVAAVASNANAEKSDQSLPQANTIRVILPSPYGQ